MNINIRNGNSLELLKDIKSDTVDCMVTDPPMGYLLCRKTGIKQFLTLLYGKNVSE